MGKYDLSLRCSLVKTNGDEESILLGSVTLKDSVKRLKAREPALFLMEECGGIEMHCGNNTV